MSDVGYMAIAAAVVLLVAGHTAWQIRGLFRARAADARLLAHGDIRYAKVVSARQSGTLIDDRSLCVVRLVDVESPATQRDIAQPIAAIDLPAIQAGCTVALRVDRSSGRALIDFSRS
ncbi:hypothetical protein HF313_20300 [Massilia atriviolacea]|uniref:DUF3592 domain-containing protein n=1 Tax=Massilia atriviolacea TaxID=2495579 RepID=A0A430HS66_9BURK|nr:hypothetical protein [Massilia atriviolacea]RSZ60360.1 hypothetical protein EJB06_04400 [Massilia atriviolacea]